MSAPTSEAELLANATAVSGCTLGDLALRYQIETPPNLKHAKGWVGELLEIVLGATGQSRPVPDFEEIGVELKTIPLNARLEPQESTFVSTAPISHTVGQTWANSSVKGKLERVLWIPVEASHEIPLASRRIGRPVLWSPSPEDREILRCDWEEHMERIALGRIDEYDARSGTYLQVRPKALNRHGRIKSTDLDGAPIQTLPRGFYLRTCFTRSILANA